MPVYLLDKNVTRRVIESLRLAREGRSLSQDHVTSLAFWESAVEQNSSVLYILPQTFHILERWPTLPEIAHLMATVQVIAVGRYVRRWARRLREYGFTREDAAVLSLGTFGTDDRGEILGVEAIITLDRPLIRNYENHRLALARRLEAMTRQLEPPFCYAAWPELWQPAEVLSVLLHPGRADEHGRAV